MEDVLAVRERLDLLVDSTQLAPVPLHGRPQLGGDDAGHLDAVSRRIDHQRFDPIAYRVLHIRPLLCSATIAALFLAAGCRTSTPPASDTTAENSTVEPRTHELRFRPTSPFNVPLPAGYRIESLTAGIDAPSAIAATPDGRIFIAEQRTGRVRVFQNGLLLDQPWVRVPVYYAEDTLLNELGLVGVLVDPMFESNGFVYLYYTTIVNDAQRTMLSRFRDVNGAGQDPVDLPPISGPLIVRVRPGLDALAEVS